MPRQDEGGMVRGKNREGSGRNAGAREAPLYRWEVSRESLGVIPGVCLAIVGPFCAMEATEGESPPHPRKDHIVSEDQARDGV